jgi:hypothetical protein
VLATCLHAFQLSLAALLMPNFQLPNLAKTSWQIHADLPCVNLCCSCQDQSLMRSSHTCG